MQWSELPDLRTGLRSFKWKKWTPSKVFTVLLPYKYDIIALHVASKEPNPSTWPCVYGMENMHLVLSWDGNPAHLDCDTLSALNPHSEYKIHCITNTRRLILNVMLCDATRDTKFSSLNRKTQQRAPDCQRHMMQRTNGDPGTSLLNLLNWQWRTFALAHTDCRRTYAEA